jgi:protein-S-isoprenylcysteine O-methyltransferase Ste14
MSRQSPATLVVTVCWSLAGLVWLVGAAYNARRAPAVLRRGSPPYGWVVVAVTIGLVSRAPTAVWRPVTLEVRWLQVLGLLILLASTAFTIWARVTLGTMWASSAVAKADHALRTGGPYGVTRHPIYTGITGMLVGSALASGFGEWTLAIVIGVAYVAAKVHTEERLLMEVFPADYPRYREHVPQIVPGLHRVLRPRPGGNDR